MADLADFFAKKDKKKSKPKKFVPEEMAQKLEEAEKKQQERERREELKREVLLREEQLEIDGAEKKKEVEEWQEVEDEEVDLTDLNIKDLQQPEPERHNTDKGAVDESSAAAEQSGPWNKSKDKRQHSPAEESEPTKAAEAAPAPAAPAAVAAAPKKYVAPGARRAMESSGLGGGMPRSPWSNKAPNIADDALFPSLGAAVETSTKPAWGQKPGRLPVEPFRQVRGSSSKDQRIAQPSKLSLGNQFDALQLSDAY